MFVCVCLSGCECGYDRVYAVGPGTNGLEVRGRASLTYDRQLNAYYVFLTVYSNVVSGESINFFIWDASQGNFLEAKLDTSVAVPFAPVVAVA